MRRAAGLPVRNERDVRSGNYDDYPHSSACNQALQSDGCGRPGRRVRHRSAIQGAPHVRAHTPRVHGLPGECWTQVARPHHHHAGHQRGRRRVDHRHHRGVLGGAVHGRRPPYRQHGVAAGGHRPSGLLLLLRADWHPGRPADAAGGSGPGNVPLHPLLAVGRRRDPCKRHGEIRPHHYQGCRHRGGGAP